MPVGAEQLAALVPVLSVLVLVGYLRGAFTVHRRRLVLVTVVVATATLLTLVQVLLGTVPSMLSLVLLAVLYLPSVLSPAGDATVYRRVGRFFVGCMAVAAVLSLLQFALQSAGLGWHDYLADVVPADLLLQDYNTGNAITYGGSVDRTTALIFLEPSFLSLFLGVAIAIALRLRMRWPVLTLLLAGIVPTVAGNGLVVAGGAVVVWFFSRSRDRLLALVPAGVLGLLVVLLTPVGSTYAARTTEGGGQNSSTGLRLVQPYLQLIPPPLQDAVTAVVGRGAGSAAVYITDNGFGTLLATVMPKILFEFGLVGIVGMLLPLLILLLSPLRRQPELIGLAVAYFVVNASLQGALMVYLVTLVLVWLPDLAHRGPAPEEDVDEAEDGEARAVAARSGPAS